MSLLRYYWCYCFCIFATFSIGVLIFVSSIISTTVRVRSIFYICDIFVLFKYLPYPMNGMILLSEPEFSPIETDGSVTWDYWRRWFCRLETLYVSFTDSLLTLSLCYFYYYSLTWTKRFVVSLETFCQGLAGMMPDSCPWLRSFFLVGVSFKMSSSWGVLFKQGSVRRVF